MLTGLGIIAIALVIWFWPQATETAAMREMSGGQAGPLPLFQVGPQSSGYWGTIVFILVLTTALLGVTATYFYLEGHIRSGSTTIAQMPRTYTTVTALVAILLVGLLSGWIVRTVKLGQGRVRAVATVVVLALLALHGSQLFAAVRAMDLAPASSGRDSAALALAGYQLIVAGILAAMLLIALIWALVRPDDARGHSTAWNAALVCRFVAISGLVAHVSLFALSRSNL
jgi:hypothetical protein